jgi:hypothetical protein
MWIRLRAWWYLRTNRPMPCDVREYIIRRTFSSAVAAQPTIEQKRKVAAEMVEGALRLEVHQISPELRDELILLKTAVEFLNKPANELPNTPGVTAPPPTTTTTPISTEK